MTLKRSLRVLHTPYNIAGHSAALAAAERRLGLDSRNVILFETGKGFPADEILTASEHDLLGVERARWVLLARALRADVIHYSFGRSILMPNAYPDCSDLLSLPLWRWPLRLYARAVWLKDARLLKALGKRIVVTWQGDDARQGDVLERLGRGEIAKSAGYYSPLTDAWKRRIIDTWATLADRQYYLNPDLAHVLPPTARFLPYASINPGELSPAPIASDPSRPLRIVHAPTHRGIKGSLHVTAAIEALRAEGQTFEFETVENLPRLEALARFREADIVIDQLMIGWYGGLAVECMALGKVVVAHIDRDDLAFVPPLMAATCPIVRAQPATLAGTLRELLAKPRTELAEIGRLGRDFAIRWHDPEQIAALLSEDYRQITSRS